MATQIQDERDAPTSQGMQDTASHHEKLREEHRAQGTSPATPLRLLASGLRDSRFLLF